MLKLYIIGLKTLNVHKELLPYVYKFDAHTHTYQDSIYEIFCIHNNIICITIDCTYRDLNNICY